jgi:hypothetical protein
MEMAQKTKQTTDSSSNRKRQQCHRERILRQRMDYDTPGKRFILEEGSGQVTIRFLEGYKKSARSRDFITIGFCINILRS